MPAPVKSAGRLAASMLFFAVAASAQAAGGALFCCTDASGKQACGDILPQACFGRGYRELGADGRTLRSVEPPLTAEQRRQRSLEDQKRQQEDALAREQQRKDQALLHTYGSLEDIEYMRQRANEDVRKSIQEAEQKIAEIRVQRKKFENEAEFYKKKTLPPEVKKGLNDTDAEIKAQESIVDSKKKELDIIRDKYDEDKRRYLDLVRRTTSR